MIKFILPILLSFTLFGCMTGSATKIQKDLNYPEYKSNLEKAIPRVNLNELDSNQAIEIAVWSSIKGSENEKSLLVEKGNKVHFIKHKETSVFPTAFEGIIYNEGDTLICSSVSNWVDPVGHSQYMLDVATGGPRINKTKSYWIYNPVALLSSSAGFYYLAKDNPLMSDEYFKKWMIVHGVGDVAVIIGVIGIITDNATMRTGGLGVGALSKIFNIFENQYITEYNGYSHGGITK